MRCERHNVETVLRCGKCEKPICPDCTVFGPVGARCRECSSNKSSPLFQVRADKLIFGSVVATTAAFAVGYLLVSTHMGLGFFGLWIALAGGGFVGEALLRTTERKRGTKMEIAAGVSTGLGALLAMIVFNLTNGAPFSVGLIFIELQHSPFYFVSIVVLICAAVSRIRFL